MRGRGPSAVVRAYDTLLQNVKDLTEVAGQLGGAAGEYLLDECSAKVKFFIQSTQAERTAQLSLPTTCCRLFGSCSIFTINIMRLPMDIRGVILFQVCKFWAASLCCEVSQSHKVGSNNFHMYVCFQAVREREILPYVENDVSYLASCRQLNFRLSAACTWQGCT